MKQKKSTKWFTKTKKSIFAVSILLIAVLVYILAAPNISSVSEYPLIEGAHRGSSIEHPENSIEGIKAALEDPNYEFIEFDVQYTKDEKLVVYHDPIALRLQGSPKIVSLMTFEELNEQGDYDAVLFEDVINLVGDRKKISIDLKPIFNIEQDKKMVDYIVSYCREKNLLDNILITSVSEDQIKYASETYPEIKTGMVYMLNPLLILPIESLITQFYEDMDELGVDYILVHGISTNNYDALMSLKPEGKTLIFWYFTDEIVIVQKDETDTLW